MKFLSLQYISVLKWASWVLVISWLRYYVWNLCQTMTDKWILLFECGSRSGCSSGIRKWVRSCNKLAVTLKSSMRRGFTVCCYSPFPSPDTLSKEWRSSSILFYLHLLFPVSCTKTLFCLEAGERLQSAPMIWSDLCQAVPPQWKGKYYS